VEVTTFVKGKWHENCYAVANRNGDAVIVDPGSQAKDIIALVHEHRWHVHAIINSHVHYDHVGAVAELQDRYQARPALRTLNFLLFDHWGGLNTLLHCVANGSPVVLPESRTQRIEPFKIPVKIQFVQEGIYSDRLKRLRSGRDAPRTGDSQNSAPEAQPQRVYGTAVSEAAGRRQVFDGQGYRVYEPLYPRGSHFFSLFPLFLRRPRPA
jgi:hypothetical protein